MLVLLACVLLWSCDWQSASPGEACTNSEVVLDGRFPGGRIDGCEVLAPHHFRLTLIPENSPINHSPWYAFRAHARELTELRVELRYALHRHRYRPKISTDGHNWQPLPADRLKVSEDGRSAELKLRVGPEGLWVAAQEVLDNRHYRQWMSRLAQQTPLSLSSLGYSEEGREIQQLSWQGEDLLVLVGRQHPPEVTGALAMQSFVERLLEPDELAVAFREHYGLLIVPNLNPDGVARGNWRHNAGGVDLNRDWGPFTQAETRAMRDELQRRADGGERVRLFLDFHSTSKDVFYTQPQDRRASAPRDFTARWMVGMSARLASSDPGYTLNEKPGHNPDKPTAKAWMHLQYDIPAITVELGDETDREFIHRYSRMAAEEMMRTLAGGAQ